MYADGCIHLHACRRMAKLERKNGFTMARHCDPETCTAYKGGEYVSIETAIRYARDGVESIRSGYGAYDVYCEHDLEPEL